VIDIYHCQAPHDNHIQLKLLTPCKLMRPLARRLGDRRDFRLALCTVLTQNGRLVRPLEPKVLKSKYCRYNSAFSKGTTLRILS
jgi:hypothetical protein